MKRTWNLITGPEILKMEDPTYLVEGVVPNRALVQFWGAIGVYKSFLALDLGCCVAAGIPWLDRFPVERGHVFYCAGEGRSGYRKRYEAWCEHRRIDPWDHPFTIIDKAPNLLDEAEVQAYTADMTRIAKGPVKLVVVDTLSTALPGGDENNSTDMSKARDNMRLFISELGCTSMAVHHDTKAGDTKGGRGHSTFFGNVDTSIEVRKHSDVNVREVRCEKQKDDEPFESIKVSFKKVLDSLVCQLPDGKDRITGLRQPILTALAGGTLSLTAITAALQLRRQTVELALKAMCVEPDPVIEELPGERGARNFRLKGTK